MCVEVAAGALAGLGEFLAEAVCVVLARWVIAVAGGHGWGRGEEGRTETVIAVGGVEEGREAGVYYADEVAGYGVFAVVDEDVALEKGVSGADHFGGRELDFSKENRSSGGEVVVLDRFHCFRFER